MAHTVQEPQILEAPAKRHYDSFTGPAALIQIAFYLLARVSMGFLLGGFGILLLIADNPIDAWGGFLMREMLSPWGLGLFAVMVALAVINVVSLLLAFVSASIKGDFGYAKRIFFGEEDRPCLHPVLKIFEDLVGLMICGIFISATVSAIQSAL
jgi:hypothetical protein